MALTTCPDCGRQVSRLAEACPQCGRAIAGKREGVFMKSMNCGCTVVLVIIIALIALVFGSVCAGSG